VSDGIRQRVMEAASSLNYRPSAAARMLASRRHETIGMVFEREQVNTRYGARLIDGVAERLSETGHRLAMGMVSWRSTAEEVENLPMLRTLSVDGLIVDTAQIRGDIDAVLARIGVPYVFVNPSGSRPYNAIMPDDLASGRQATDYMIERGHKRIAFMPCGKEVHHSSGQDRMNGYARAMSRAGLSPIPGWDELIRDVYAAEDEYAQRLKSYREEHDCTAVVCHTSAEAVRSLMGCYRFGIRVPEDVALVSCDIEPSMATSPISQPGIHLDRYEMGRMAVDMLHERIENPRADLPTVYYKGKLIENCLNLFAP
jgi:DNA-binding LacI/PurR family transcriptional regulator